MDKSSTVGLPSIRNATVRVLCESYGGRSPTVTMKLLASDLRAKSGQKTPPYNPELMIPYCHVPMQNKVNFIDTAHDGYISRSGRGYVISVNIQQSSSRQRFSIAHELGHTFFLPYREGSYTDNPDSTDEHSTDPEEERLCNIFAAELLMPEILVSNDIAGKALTADMVVSLAKKYETSVQVTAIRICQVTDMPLLIGLLNQPQNDATSHLCLLWRVPSKSAAVDEKAPIVFGESVLPTMSLLFDRPFKTDMTMDLGHGAEKYPVTVCPLSSTKGSQVLFTALVPPKTGRVKLQYGRRTKSPKVTQKRSSSS